MKNVRTRKELITEGLGDNLQTVDDYMTWATVIVMEWIGADSTGSTTFDEGIHQAVAALQDLVEHALALRNYRVVSLVADALETGIMIVDDGEIRYFKDYIDDSK